ncbi:hypothetical protein BGZ89_004911 [Linnemannia elongata]|nr:hypothetical protein BGZ89_004911 [Linnemannia elongata]
MDLIARLPLECLQQILAILHKDEQFSSLATLLATNKYIASITLPYLYTEPFRAPLSQQSIDGDPPPPSNPSVFVGNLTRLLLSQAYTRYQGEELHKVLRVTFNLDDTNRRSCNSDEGSLDYLAHIRNLFLLQWSASPNNFQRLRALPAVRAYVQSDDFKPISRRMSQKLFPFHPELIRFHHFWVTLNREANWALARPILGQLRTLTIPTSDIGRYLSVVGRLAQLECVQFRLDEAFVFEASRFGNIPTPEAIEFTRVNKEHWDAVKRDVVRFVEELTRNFPGSLKTAMFTDAGFWPWIQQSFPGDVQFEVFRLLPPLVRPTQLTPFNWLQFAAHPLETDLEQVKEFNPGKDAKDAHTRLREIRGFLQRCRALTLLILPSLGQGSFSWAVQEKRDLQDVLNNNNGISFCSGQGQGKGSTTLLLDTSRPAYIRHGLVPLERVEIQEFQDPFTDEVDDIAYAFSQTLTYLKADASSFITQLSRSIHFGRGWVELPNLRHLSMNAKNARLIIERNVLSLCPNIERVDLADQTHQYQCQDLREPWLPALLGQLKSLILIGSTALTFHPDTLYTTSKITHLCLSTYMEHDQCFIPPIDELNRSYGIPSTSQENIPTGTGPSAMTAAIIRPHWSWDWHLPHLKSLYLTSEFAFRFRFQMLRGCPALEDLNLDISTATNQHPRSLTITDLYATPTISDTHNDNDSIFPAQSQREQELHQRQEDERIVAPSVTSLRLAGRWILKDAFLPDFLTETFPNLHSLIEKDWDTGFFGIGRDSDGNNNNNTNATVAGLVRCIRAAAAANKLKLEELDLTLPEPHSEERTELGMVTGFGVPEDKKLPVTFYFEEMQYDLLVDPADRG